MINEPVRKLAVLLHADVAESTYLVRLDETVAHERIRDAFRRLAGTVTRYQGAPHEVRGDALVAEFGRVSDAVSAALAFQVGNAAKNDELPDEIRPVVRIGIALGEVVVGDGTITGEGVVLSQRLEQLAKPGGVCIQGAAYESIPKRFPFGFESLGEVCLKGFDEPIKALRVQLRPGAGIPDPDPSIRQNRQEPQLTIKPSIAVLPFENMSGDPEQDYFAEGISEDIITGLSRFHWFFVIARNSSFAYKDKSIDVKQVAQELGVRYLLQGSVRKSGDRVRISARLVDAGIGHQVWADRFDRSLEDVFAVQDEISSAITTMVAPAFISAEAQRAERKAPENFDAWDYTIRGNWHLSRGGRSDLADARRFFESALRLDPKSTAALSGLAFTFCWMNIFGWDDDPQAIREQAYELGRKAVGHDDEDAWAHAVLGWVRFIRRELDSSITECRRALDLNPNLALAESILSLAYSWRGDNAEAMEHAANAERLSPRDPVQSMWSFARSSAAFGVGNYEEAVRWGKLAADVMPEFPGAWRYLASSLALLDRVDEARGAVRKLLEVFPHDNLRRVREGLPSVCQERLDRLVEGLAKAGLPP